MYCGPLEVENGKGGDMRQKSHASWGSLFSYRSESEELVHDLVFHSSDSDNTSYLQLMSISYANDGPRQRQKIKVFSRFWMQVE